MQQSGQSDQLPLALCVSVGRDADSLRNTPGHVHDPEGVFKPGVSSAGVDEMSKRELLHTAQPLEDRRVDELFFDLSVRYEPVDRVTDSQWPAHDVPRGLG